MFGVAMLLLCDAWRVWMTASFSTLCFTDRNTADTLAPYWWVLLALVAVYDTIGILRRD